MSLKCVNLPKPVKTKHSPIRIKQILVSSVEIDLIKVHLPSYLGHFLGLLNDLRQLSAVSGKTLDRAASFVLSPTQLFFLQHRNLSWSSERSAHKVTAEAMSIMFTIKQAGSFYKAHKAFALGHKI